MHTLWASSDLMCDTLFSGKAESNIFLGNFWHLGLRKKLSDLSSSKAGGSELSSDSNGCIKHLITRNWEDTFLCTAKPAAILTAFIKHHSYSFPCQTELLVLMPCKAQLLVSNIAVIPLCMQNKISFRSTERKTVSLFRSFICTDLILLLYSELLPSLQPLVRCAEVCAGAIRLSLSTC